jgi:hypothetical protein
MNNLNAPRDRNWSICWLYTRDEWHYFEKWRSRRKGLLLYAWYSLFMKKEYVSSIQFTRQWVKIGDKTKYFNGPVTEIRRTDIYDKGLINILTITYENVSKNQLAEVSILIPRGKLREAIDAQQKLNENVKFKLN